MLTSRCCKKFNCFERRLNYFDLLFCDCRNSITSNPLSILKLSVMKNKLGVTMRSSDFNSKETMVLVVREKLLEIYL